MEIQDVAPSADYSGEYGLLLAALNDGTREWMGEIGEPAEEAIVWQPFPGGPSIGGIVLHMADTEVWWLEESALKRPLSAADRALFMDEETNVDEGIWPTPPRRPWSWYVQIIVDARRRTQQALKDFPRGDETYEHHGRLITFRWVLAHVLQHDSYHGGQAVLMHNLYLQSRK